MNAKSYAYAVANIRAAENELLNSDFFDRLVNSSLVEAKRMISDKGMDIDGGFMQRVWEYVKEIAPQPEMLEFLVVKNDFHNLKAAFKGMVSETDVSNAFLYPSVIEPETLYKTVKSKKFDFLPDWICNTAKEAFEILTTAFDGRTFDMFTDAKSLEAVTSFANKSGSEFCVDYAETFVALTNFKIALRLSENDFNESLSDCAFATCRDVDLGLLKSAVVKGKDAVVSYFEKCGFPFQAPSISKSYAAFERECADYLNSLLENGRKVAFGIEPIAAYYIAKETEFKNIKLILGAKEAGVSPEAIAERVCAVYV